MKRKQVGFYRQASVGRRAVRKWVGALSLLLVCLVPLHAAANTLSWTGGGDGTNWFTAGNWSTLSVPGAGDTVSVVSGNIVLTNETAILGSFTMDGGTMTYKNWMTRLQATNVVINGGTHTLSGRFTELQMSNRVWIVCYNDFTLNAGGVINVKEKGFAAANGPGKGGNGDESSGGGYGGKGGRSHRPEYAGGMFYGSTHAPVAPGSGAGFSSSYAGPAGGSSGGGAVRIDVTGTATIHGTINADGGTHATHGYNGGGSGGAIYITCDTFQGSTNGLLRANGGSTFLSPTSGGVNSYGGAGGGGRIAVDYTHLGAQHAVRFSTSPGWCWVNADMDNNWYQAAEWGTVWVPDTGLLSAMMTDHLFTDCRLYIKDNRSWAVDSLTVTNCSFAFAEPGYKLTVTNDLQIGTNGHVGVGAKSSVSNAILTCKNMSLTHGGGLSIYSGKTNGIVANYGALVDVSGDVAIDSGSWIFPYSHEIDGGSVLFRMTNLTIAANGGFNAAGKGFAQDQGPGNTVKGGGAAYGGKGGRGNVATQIGGSPYGSAVAPLAPGSGAANSTYGQSRGGGLVRIEASGDAVIDGSIKANGVSPTHYYVSAGSGGGIYLNCTTFSGSASGLLSADGGNAVFVPENRGGGGGGGRIAVHYTSLGSPHAARFSTSSGWGWADRELDERWWAAAGWGTLYLSDASLLSEPLTDGLFNKVRLVIDGFTSWTVNSLVVSNCSVTFENPIQLTVSGDLNIVDGFLGIHDLTCGGNVVLTNSGKLSVFNLDCGGNLSVTAGSSLSVYSGMTNGIAGNSGALVNIAGDVNVASSSWIYPYSHAINGGSPLFRMANLHIAPNSGFNAIGRGYAFAQGPGRGSQTPSYGGGGGYGGKGGRGSPATSLGGVANGLINAPLSPGSGSGESQYSSSYGGGLVRIEAVNRVTLNGTIKANGGTSFHAYGGSGSGGGILVSCNNFEGDATGVLSANGGNSGSDGGGGGGGRIAVWRRVASKTRDALFAGREVKGITVTSDYAGYLGSVSVASGTGWSAVAPDKAEPGTHIFLLGPPTGTMILIR